MHRIFSSIFLLNLVELSRLQIKARKLLTVSDFGKINFSLRNLFFIYKILVRSKWFLTCFAWQQDVFVHLAFVALWRPLVLYLQFFAGHQCQRIINYLNKENYLLNKQVLHFIHLYAKKNLRRSTRIVIFMTSSTFNHKIYPNMINSVMT